MKSQKHLGGTYCLVRDQSLSLNLTKMDVLSDEIRDFGLSSDWDKNERLALLISQTFNMDHILETVLTHVSLNTVYDCRFASHRWAFLGSREAQNRSDWRWFKLDTETGRPMLCCESNRKLFLSDLITLMDSSTAGFPCNSFIIDSRIYKNPVVQRFLNVHGGHIMRLRLSEPSCRHQFEKEPTHEFVVHTRIVNKYKQTITFWSLTRLLLIQCPHLRIFECNARIEAPAKSNSHTGFDPNELAGMVWRSKEGNPDFKFHFRVFSMHNRSIFPEKLLQAILLCSPHLKQVFLESCNYHCLVQPVNRLYLLTGMSLMLNDLGDLKSLKALDEVVKHVDGSWPLTFLHLDGSCLFDKPHLWFRSTRIINRLLRGISSSSTCKTFAYYGMDFLKGIRIPPMRSVEYLHLYVRKGLKTLPEGVTLGDAFPNLRSLHVRCKYPTDEIYPLLDVFNSDQPVPGVKYVELLWFREPQFAEGVKGLFPNAQVENIPCPSYFSNEQIRVQDI